jgi:adenylyl-sulfate kinase
MDTCGRPFCLWLTGLPASGKSTLASVLHKELAKRSVRAYSLDGDVLRSGINSNLGFSVLDRSESVRRASEVAALMVDAGIIVIASLISPFTADRRAAREKFPEGTFIEVFVDTPLHVCERRDPKGLYRLARAGDLPDFTGIGSPYERPTDCEIHALFDGRGAEFVANDIIEQLIGRGLLAPAGKSALPDDHKLAGR